MSKKAPLILITCLLAACATEKPHIIQATADMEAIQLTSGMATQIEMPTSGRVQSVTVGNPALVTADKTENIVNLLPKDGTGETNLIVHAVDEDGHAKLYQYRLNVEPR